MRRHQKTVLALVVSCFAATGCESDPHLAAGTAELASPSQAVQALEALAQRLLDAGASLGAEEDALFQITQHLPVTEGLEFDDDDDLKEFEDTIRPLFDTLKARAKGGFLSKTSKLSVPAPLLCELVAKPDEPRFQDCVNTIDAVGLTMAFGVDGAEFVVRFGFVGVTPLVVRIGKTSLLAQVDLAVAPAFLEVVTTLLGANLGQQTLDDFFGLEGQLAVRVTASSKGLGLDVTMPKDLKAHIANTSFALEKRKGAADDSILSLRAGQNIGVTIFLGPITVTNLPLGLINAERFGEGAVGNFSFAGLAYEGTALNQDAMSFRADIGDLEVSKTLDKEKTVLFGRRSLSGEMIGTAAGKERLGRFDLRRGFSTIYESDLRVETTHLGVTAVHNIPKGTTLVDFRRSTIAKKKAQLELVFKGQLTKLNELVCAKDGTVTISVAGENARTLTANADEDDNCLAGYFAKENDVPVYRYELL